VRRTAVAVAVVVALAAGGGSAWALDERGRAGDEASRERVASAVAAGVDDDETATQLASRSAGEVSRALLADSRQGLAAALPQVQGVLEASAGQVADDAVRQALATAIARARAALDAGVAPVRADALAGELVATAGVVTTAQAEWLAAKKAAEEAAVAAAARSGASGSTGVCVDTYVRSDWPPSEPTAAGDGTNGNMNIASMTPLSWTSDPRGQQYWLAAEATTALEQLNVAFRAEFGHDLPIDLAYRDLQTQREMKAALGPIAATPGESNHGLGKAFDLPEWTCQYGFGTAKHNWLAQHGPAYGWYELRSEYWHFDFKR